MKKKIYLVALIGSVSLAVMSFSSPNYSETALTANKVNINLGENDKINLAASESVVPAAVVVVVALAETSAAAVVVATAAAVSWLISCKTDLAPVSEQYKTILNEIDMRKLDNRN